MTTPRRTVGRYLTRFSLRELLLAITAVCGLAAGYRANRPFSPTKFLTTFRPQQVVLPLIQAAHPGGLSYGTSGGGDSFSGSYETQQFALDYEVTIPTAASLLGALRGAIEKELAKDGATILSRSATTGESIGFVYQNGRNLGFVWVYGYQGPNDVKIRYLAHEHR